MTQPVEIEAPVQITNQIIKGQRIRDADVIRHLAFFELGVSPYKNEYELMRSLGLNYRETKRYKDDFRAKIDEYKKIHSEGKMWILEEIKERAKITVSLREALLNNLQAEAKVFSEALRLLEEVAPVARLKVMYEFGKEKETSDKIKSATQINIGNVDSLKQAEAHLAEIKRQK